MDKQQAEAIIRDLKFSSEVVLDTLGLPHTPGKRVRPWRGTGPEGIAYHYTGGPDGLRTLRWFLDPGWKNEESSAHVLILDRCPESIRKAWSLSPAALVFRVPVLLIASLDQGTWCTNWVNNRCLGVELRNVGDRAASLGIPGELRAGRLWERYTRGQVAAAIVLGQVFRAIQGEVFRPEWVVGHHMIWGTKSDPGPLFPLHNIRSAILSGQAPEDLPWLLTPDFPEAIPEAVPDSIPGTVTRAGEFRGGFRGDPERTEAQWHAGPERLIPDSEWLARALYRLGWMTWPKVPDWDGLRTVVGYFQRSTLAYQGTNPGRVLKVDGDCGPLTRAALEARLTQLGL
jgi:N-acetyl-anhydromuramyl-L-alanine amidase AmpD